MSHRIAAARHGILRAVYESNLNREVSPQGAGPGAIRPGTGPAARRRGIWLLLLLAPLAGLVAYLLYPQETASIAAVPRQQAGLEGESRSRGPGLQQALAAVGDGVPGLPTAAPVSSQDYLALVQDGARGSLAALFDLGVRTLVIDAGHGGRDPGAIGPAGLREKDVTLDIATRLYERLRARGALRVLMTRIGDRTLSLKERVAFANAQGADLFLSIHVNALPVAQPTVVETYYFGPQSDPAALRVAQVENRGSEYVMAEFREIIEKLDDSFKHQESRRLAQAIQGSLYRNIRGHHNAALVSWGIKSAPFIVLLGADMPSVLTEVTTLSNPREERRLQTASYRRQIASYLEQGLVEYLGMNRRQEGPTIGANTDGSNDPKENQTAKEKGSGTERRDRPGHLALGHIRQRRRP